MKKSELTRENIIKQSSEIFNLKGFVGASMQDVMEKTGLQKGGIYRHFESKEQLAIEVFRYSFSLLKQKYVGAYLPGDTPDVKLIKFLEKMKDNDLTIIGGCPILNTGIEADDTNEALRIEATKALEQWKKMVKNILRQGMEQGLFNQHIDPEKEAYFLIASIEGGIFLSKLHKDRKHLKLIADCLIERIKTILMKK